MDISILEFIVYGLIAYSSMLMLIISTIKEVPSGKSHSIVRVMYLIPGIFCAVILAGSGVNIITEDVVTTNTIVNLNTTEVFTESFNQTRLIELQNPIWISFHFLLAAVMVVYVISQIVTLFTKV